MSGATDRHAGGLLPVMNGGLCARPSSSPDVIENGFEFARFLTFSPPTLGQAVSVTYPPLCWGEMLAAADAGARGWGGAAAGSD